MEKFTRSSKMAEMVLVNYHLLPVLNRFGIELGFKDKTVEQICEELNIDSFFFLAIVNTFHNKNYFPEDEIQRFSAAQVIEYLEKTHMYYRGYVMPKLEYSLQKVIESSDAGNKELRMIETFYRKYKEEFLLHMQEEEESTFPYVLNLVKNHSLKENYSIRSFEKEHSNVDFKLNDLKNIIIKYIKPAYDANMCNEFLITLLRFEKDVQEHARIEDKILVPLVRTIEEKIHG